MSDQELMRLRNYWKFLVSTSLSKSLFKLGCQIGLAVAYAEWISEVL